MEQEEKQKEMQQYLQGKLDDAKACINEAAECLATKGASTFWRLWGKEIHYYGRLEQYYTDVIYYMDYEYPVELFHGFLTHLNLERQRRVDAASTTSHEADTIQQEIEAATEAFAVIRNIVDYLKS